MLIGVSVVGGIAYVAANVAGLQLINVSNPTNPSLLGSFNTAGNAYGVSVVGSIAYVADDFGLQLINVSNPTNPSLLGSFNTARTLLVSAWLVVLPMWQLMCWFAND